ncbi:hypothetical protein [Salisediminibacterium halotolerans]|uniref:hypothetical protein n=1 Tax=Salisediminibacterium halotolerans TaxID=517425 RepID=UPI000EB4A427|nr:hypothetical protein [Salisediminibacterium halotolerans]RLJ73224.1 hypothetical protein BCL39_1979 [Actinophytocola xinjiangensis]RPE86646.1 hypothetical protein EDD67_2102 [Salisediminibacterium halotolerans]TWG34021.1 hypothetical protein BCL52_1976 [Salisediminibacterium halotolerans]GEL09079.1 hypothetical protein SHA02_24950 [Salisediminibacterium halotolerans]
MGSHLIQINPYDKRMNIKIEGLFNEHDWTELLQSYQDNRSLISPQSYNIELDCLSFPLQSDYQWHLLERCYNFFNNESFRQISFIINQSKQHVDHSFRQAALNEQFANLQWREV